MYDLAIIGSGPSGLAGAINASSEGLSTIVLESSLELGGQASHSSSLENVFGFPEGITGRELTSRALTQASKFKTEFLAPFSVNSIQPIDKYINVWNEYNEKVEARSVLLTMGVSYKTLMVPNLARFIGYGVSYGSPSLSEDYTGKVLTVIGGANSAGQAAYYLATCKKCYVHLIIRSKNISDKMSDYLIEKLKIMPNVEVLTETEVVGVSGTSRLQTIMLKNTLGTTEVKCDRLFILIGATPRTHWLEACGCTLDKNGFVVTDNNLQTAIPGVYSAGDVRSGSVKRVQSATGEGAMAINSIHQYLSSLK